MRALFWKLFGAFWLTTVAILAISIFVTFRLAGEATTSFADPREVESLLEDVLQTNGLNGLRNYVADKNNFPTGQTVYLIDEAGNDLLGRPIPRHYAERARRVWRIVSDHNHRGRGQTRRLREYFLETADGTRLLSMPGPVPPARFGVLSSNNVRWTVLSLAAGISLLSFWLLSRSLTRPVARISGTASSLAKGDMSARVGPAAYTGDEIGQLAKQFDRMAEELETQSKTKRELFRNIAHEMRAPLTRLQIATELLERQPERSDAHVERIRYEIERVEYLTRQVLDLARADQEIGLNESTCLTDVLRQVTADAEFEARSHGIELEYHEPDQELQIKGQSAAIASAIENVIRNAIQFAQNAVEVRLMTDNGEFCTVTVSDDGPGVPEEELEKIFEPFYRIDTNRPGAGIGLAISKRVVEQLNGELVACNEPDGGLQIVVRLQRADS